MRWFAVNLPFISKFKAGVFHQFTFSLVFVQNILQERLFESLRCLQGPSRNAESVFLALKAEKCFLALKCPFLSYIFPSPSSFTHPLSLSFSLPSGSITLSLRVSLRVCMFCMSLDSCLSSDRDTITPWFWPVSAVSGQINH